MSQNRNKLINLFASNLVNAILHKVLEKAINDEAISKRYSKEILNSWEIAKSYRQKINPINSPLPAKDIEAIKRKVIAKVNSVIRARISRGYKNLNTSNVEEAVNDALKKLNVVDSKD